MSLPDQCKITEHCFFDETIENRKFEKEQIKSKLQNDAPFGHPIIVTKLPAHGYAYPIRKLKTLIDAKTPTTPDFLARCRLSAVASIPDISEESKSTDCFPLLRIYNSKTGQCRPISKSEGTKPKQNEKVALFLQLLCKDEST